MKSRLCIITLLLILLLWTTAYAEQSLIESPNVRIVIDGEVDTYVDTPLIINNRTLLPLREILTNLGIPNDDDHIIWNATERSVTIKTETQTIWLQVNNNTAMLNGENITLDVAPMIYAKNNRTYIPARFISESLNKKVVWDGSTTTVLITDRERHNQILELLSKIKDIDTASNYQLDMLYLLNIADGEETANIKMNLSLMDNTQQKSSYTTLNMDMGIQDDVPLVLSMEMYQLPDYTYTKTSIFGDSWIKTETSAEDEATTKNSIVDFKAFSMAADDIVAAGLIIEDNPDENTICLKGNVYLNELINQSIFLTNKEIKATPLNIKNYYITMIIDRTSYTLREFSADMTFNMENETGNPISATAKITLRITPLENDYKIIVPEEILKTTSEF